MSHPNARLTSAGRLLIVQQTEDGFSQAEVARRMYLSRSTVSKWWRRYQEAGMEGLEDRPSTAKRLRHALGQEVIQAICALRRELGAGPHRLAWELGMARSTIYGVLRRQGLSVLTHMERTTRAVIRYERGRPGELVHLDVKKLGRIPEGGGKRFDEGFKETGAGRHRPGKRGFEYVHVAVDDHSRFAYAEIRPDEKGPTTAAFLARTVLAFAREGIRIQRVFSDNGGNYRSSPFRDMAEAQRITLKKTRPYRPQTNGKAEAFNKTLQRKWAYLRPYLSNHEHALHSSPSSMTTPSLVPTLPLATGRRLPACKQRSWEQRVAGGRRRAECGSLPVSNGHDSNTTGYADGSRPKSPKSWRGLS